jgi:hypothetical protein
MNAAASFPISGEVAPPPVRTNPEPPVYLTRLLLGLALNVGILDFCFWGVRGAGCSIALFAAVLTAIILGNRELPSERRVTQIILALLAGAALATVIETGPTTIIVLLILIVTLAGHTYFIRADSFWGRSLSQGLLLTIPALVLALVFGSLLATGNTVFGSWTNSFFDWVWQELDEYLNAWRISLWIFAVFAVLPLLRPTSVSDRWWRWTERLPRLPELVPSQGAFFSSVLVLIVLNLLFFVANIADAIFLWSGDTKLPVGVTYSGYVHHGVSALTIAVVLSAFILTFIFQQSLQVAGRRELKVLAVAWIAQNLFLLLSVALRLKLYIEAYDMTVERLSVVIFLVLVASGFGLLTIKIVKDRSLSWLVGSCAVAVFGTLYITQFLNLGGWSADYNVARWEGDRTRRLDVYYLSSLGPAGWPALARANDLGALARFEGEAGNPWLKARFSESVQPRGLFDAQHWRVQPPRVPESLGSRRKAE